MKVTMTPQFEKMVKEKVESGLYASAEEVFAEAMRLLEWRDKKLAALRRDIQEGLESGPSEPLDIEAIIARGYERLERRQESAES
ncbi:MAG: type II toxin-antitoxin system ParD family antitoxin [Chloroflexi bacterium]|nr:type II toxin-antitoxin system ParD family antitoxin [Chloroflexota bacterium]